MKKFTKLLGIVLIIALVMSMGITAAFADDTGTITIKSSEDGTTYNFYQLLNLTGSDTTDPADGEYDAVVYTVNSKWKTFMATYLVNANVPSANGGKGLNPINVDGTIKYINITESNIVAFTNAAMDYAIKNNVAADATATGDGKDVSKANLPLGYYLMIPVDASLLTTESSGSVASITSTIPNAEIQVKAKKPSIDKVDDKITVDVGETVTYTVTGTMPSTAGYETYKYVIKDEMTNGLTFQKDVKVEVNGTNVTDQVTFDYTVDNKFSADIPVKALQGANGVNVGKEIKLTYTAIVNDNAVTNTTLQEKNKVHLEYGHNPDKLEETTPIEEEVYTTKVVINKYTGGTKDATTGAITGDTKLPGAKFALMKIVNNKALYYKYTAATTTAPITPAKVEWVEITGAPSSGTASVTDAMAKALADAETSYTPKTTDGNGAAEFPGIADGTYYLVEYAAPTGYNRLDKPQEVVVTGTDADAKNDNKTENHADATGEYDTKPDGGVKADVENNSGTVLPSTGGIGTTIFYVVGSIMVVAAGVLLITKKRMGRE